MRERLRVSLEKNSTLEEELNLTKDEVSVCFVVAKIERIKQTKMIEHIVFVSMQLQQFRSGVIQINNQNDGTKSSDGIKVSERNDS